VILALESSCDESAVALFDPDSGLAGEWVHSQVALHREHGGVVPDLATREHLKHLGPLLAQARAQPGWGSIGSVAVTRGPGLAACLAVGVAAAKAVAAHLRVPVAGVNHLRAHAWSPFLPVHAAAPAAFPERLAALLPHLGLIVSGGNTLLFELRADRQIVELATTRDDAAGEALDKGGKLLGLGYPAGPAVERHAALGRPDAFAFPRGLGPREELGFSFSGLKTSLRYRVQAMPEAEVEAALGDLCASYQAAVVDALLARTEQALVARPYRSLGLSGGVANNRRLRAVLAALAQRAGVAFLAADPRHTGDNAGMVGFAAWADAADAARFAGAGLAVDPGAYL